MSMSVEIPMGTPPAAAGEAATPRPPVSAEPVHVLVSPIAPVAADGASAAATAPPPAYTGVLYLQQQHRWGRGEREDDDNRKRERWLQEMRGWLMVLAVLAASVTYQAGLNPPGGFWQQDDAHGNVAGTPVLESKFPKRYKVFFYFNSTAFVTSVVIIVLLMNESFYHSEAKVEALEIIVVLDMAGLMGAYIAGCTREVSSSIYVIVLAVVVFLYVVYTARFLPKLWGLVLGVPCVHKAAVGGALSVPRDILEEATPGRQRDEVARSKSAPAP
ncbi:hypothetical protein ACP70R_041411 [Stipagrostis hirtigluma subsp. patula]